MYDDDRWEVVDGARSAQLYDVGAPGHMAATVIGADGDEHLIFAHIEDLGDEAVAYRPNCPDASHEQVGPLPLEFVRRIAISRRSGKPTE